MTRVALALAMSLFPAGQSTAQPQTCEDAFEALRVLTEHVVRSRSRGEGEMAQEIARLLRRSQALQAELDALKAKPEAPK